jgi:hypothetical protein
MRPKFIAVLQRRDTYIQSVPEEEYRLGPFESLRAENGHLFGYTKADRPSIHRVQIAYFDSDEKRWLVPSLPDDTEGFAAWYTEFNYGEPQEAIKPPKRRSVVLEK